MTRIKIKIFPVERHIDLNSQPFDKILVLRLGFKTTHAQSYALRVMSETLERIGGVRS